MIVLRKKARIGRAAKNFLLFYKGEAIMAIQMSLRGRETLANAWAKEARQPANCFRLNGADGVVEGIEMTLDHPSLPGRPAVFAGNWGVCRNRRDGCLYCPVGNGTAVVNRASVEWVPVREGKPFPTLVKPEGKTGEAILHVSASAPVHILIKRKFWAGVISGEGAKILASCYKEKEFIIHFSAENASAAVFYEDGSVRGLLLENGRLKVVDFSLEDQVKARIRQAEGLLEEAEALGSDDRARKQDFALHLLCDILSVAGKRSEEMFDLAFSKILDAAEDGIVRPGVKSHAERAICQAMDDPEEKLLLLRGSVETAGNGSGGMEFTSHRANGKGLPAKARGRKAERSLADRALRASMRGKTGVVTGRKAGSGKRGKK